MRKRKIGSYTVTEEAEHIKVSHENKTFNFRIQATGDACNTFFRELRNAETAEGFSTVFAIIHLSTIRSIQDPVFARKLMLLLNEGSDVELTKEQDDKIIEEEKALYEMGKSEDECTE